MTGTEILDEILREYAVSNRGQVKPRGVRREMSSYPPAPPGAGVPETAITDTENPENMNNRHRKS